MNTFTKLLTFALVIVSLAGCSKEKDKAEVQVSTRGQRGAMGPSPTVSANVSYQLVGTVTADSYYQDEFQDSVRGFLLATLPENYVGYVSAVGAHGTGVAFGGRVMLQGGSIRTIQPGQQLQIAPNSEILVGVYDYWPNQQSPGPIPVYLTMAQGKINGNYAELMFYDQVGMIILEGQFDANKFEGVFKYSNFVRYDNTPLPEQSEPGLLGTFSVPTCQFFVCQ